MTEEVLTTEATTDSKFAQWVRKYGVSKLVNEMHKLGPDYAVTYSAVYQWLRKQHEPRPRKIRAIAEISAGALTVGDIHDHFSGVALREQE